ncbi:MAG: ComEC/Rec2 family competence protein [Candidatus Magasanikbacteria bacterium]
MQTIFQSKSKTFFTFCFCFLLGIAVASLYNLSFPGEYIYIFVFVYFALVILFWKVEYYKYILLCILFFSFGIMRFSFGIPTEKILEYKDDEVPLLGYVSTEPDVRIDGVRYILHITEGKAKGEKVYISSDLYPRYVYGDRLQVLCTIREPEPIEDFRYDMYLARMGVSGLCTNANITKVGEGDGNSFFRGIYTIKSSVAERIELLWHEPYASFMAGLLYGYRGGLGSLNEDFNRTGVTHIVAISGYNITIVVTLFLLLLSRLSLERKKSFYIIVCGVLVFVIFAGLSGSVVRAGIMGILVLLARHVGRMSYPRNILIFTAVLMCLENPYILLWDAGFQLSFLATLGLLYINPLLEKQSANFPELFGIKESFITTFSATIITFPLILFQFGRFSVVSIIVNILILWIIPYIMALGFFAVIFSYIWYPFAFLFSAIPFFGMAYITTVVRLFSSFSFASIELQVSFFVVVLLYSILFFWYKKRAKEVALSDL